MYVRSTVHSSLTQRVSNERKLKPRSQNIHSTKEIKESGRSTTRRKKRSLFSQDEAAANRTEYRVACFYGRSTIFTHRLSCEIFTNCSHMLATLGEKDYFIKNTAKINKTNKRKSFERFYWGNRRTKSNAHKTHTETTKRNSCGRQQSCLNKEITSTGNRNLMNFSVLCFL